MNAQTVGNALPDNDLPNNALSSDTLSIPVDKEHGGIRLIIFLVFIAAWVASFVLLSIVIPNDGFSVLAILLGLGISYVVTSLVDRLLKQRWPSGRVVQVDKNGVKVIHKAKLQHEMPSEDPANMILWSFRISKRTRIPKGWSMMACALEYETNYLTVYTFMSPADIEKFEMAGQFKKLLTKRKGKGDADAREDLRVAGEQRRLRDAENQRWMFGAEMTPADFTTYLTRIKAQFPEWMPVT